MVLEGFMQEKHYYEKKLFNQEFITQPVSTIVFVFEKMTYFGSLIFKNGIITLPITGTFHFALTQKNTNCVRLLVIFLFMLLNYV